MPEPVRSGQRYLPGLDGLRALAVFAVIAFHVQLGWARGGLLGVGMFFTLSGYLITDLLLGQWAADGRLHLADFCLRRARRLLPALFVLLSVVTAWATLMDRSQLAGLRGAVAAAAAYVSNWYLIVQHNSYFARFGAARSARPSVVTGGGGAVLPRLALAALAGPALPAGTAGERAAVAGRAHARAGGRISRRNGPALPPRARPDTGV